MKLIDRINPDIFSAYLYFPMAFDNEKTDLRELVTTLEKDPFRHWRLKDYVIHEGVDYNEFVYFYRYVSDILFSKSSEKPRDFFFLRWDKDLLPLWLRMKYRNGKSEGLLEVRVEDVYLHMHNFGVGILIIELGEEDGGRNLREYIRILNLARRLYPADVNRDANLSNLGEHDVSVVERGECPVQVELVDNRREVLAQHNFVKDNRWALDELNRQIPTLSGIITYLLDTRRGKFHFEFAEGDYWSIVDDRTFIHSFYRLPLYEEGSRKFMRGLEKYFNGNVLGEDEEVEQALDCWYQMIHIDQESPSCPNRLLKEKILKKATYRRWINPPKSSRYSSTVYGFSRFSSVMITGIKEEKVKKDPSDFSRILHAHFHSMYYQMAVLLFFYRGVLLAFSRRSAKIVKLFQRSTRGKGRKLLERLQREFLLFRNRFWFKEVTAQDQGIEMFRIWARRMNIYELMDDVKNEIQELYDFVRYKNEQRMDRLLFILTLIGAILLPITVVTGFLGMNIFGAKSPLSVHPFDWSQGWVWFWVPLGALYIIIFPIVLYYHFKRN